MKSSAVQFRGKAQVLKAYEANDIPAWSMWNGQNLMFAYEGDNMEEGKEQISQAMDLLADGGSEAAFTLKLYRRLKGDIDSKTPYSNAFNFGLFGFNQAGSPYQERQSSVAGAIGKLEERFERMQEEMIGKLLDRLDEGDEKKEKAGGIIGTLNTLIEMPEIQSRIAMGAISLLGKILPMKPEQRPASVAGVEQGAAPKTLLTQDQVDKVHAALSVLCTVDAQLGDHLAAIAKIAVEDPGKYRMFTGML